MEQIKKIDVHAHCSIFSKIAPGHSRKSSQYSWLSPEELIDFYDRLNIEKGLLLPMSAPEGLLSVVSSEECNYISDLHPGRFAWSCCVDPRAFTNTDDADLGYALEHYVARGARSVGEVTANIYLDDPRAMNLFGFCNEMGLAVTMHYASRVGRSYGLVDDYGLPRLEKVLKTYPNLKIFGHSQRFWCEMGDNAKDSSYPDGPVKNGRIPELMRKYENLYCEFSNDSGSRALMRDREHAAKFIEEFSDRLMYACDICSTLNTFMFTFDEFLTSMRESGEISEQNYRKLVRENAIRILNL